ncbi:hypothetical protein [Bacillus thuringiensis]|uniref:hypothetical protein n=1 Tax=Bacillus thuringiensis TaxID=1428 RepID=UPI000BF7188E|nr:hypothetical protein [Bacillus thuringiensis]PES36705.1 hypothetical protein CN499_32395 [Bacillus thuringiensis]
MDEYYWIERGIKWLGSLGIFTFGTLSISAGIGYVLQKTWLHVLKNREEDHKSELRKREADFKRLLDEQVEDHKSELRKREADFKGILDKQLEEHKSELKKINDKYQIMFSKLHVDRAEIIKELYTKLVDLESSTYDLLGPKGIVNRSFDKSMDLSELKESLVNTMNKFLELEEMYKLNRIYFKVGICELFEGVRTNVNIVTSGMLLYVSNYEGPDEVSGVLRTELKNIEENTVNRILREIPKLKKALEEEFRRLLGVIEDQKE